MLFRDKNGGRREEGETGLEHEPEMDFSGVAL